MADKLSWIFELVDKVTKPAHQAAEASAGFEKELKKVHDQIERINKNPLQFKQLQAAKNELRELTGHSRSFAERFEEMGSAIKRVGFVQNLMLGAEALKLGFEAGEKLVDVVVDVGKEMISAAGHAERMQISFEAMLGADGAKEVAGYIEQIEKHTELTNNELEDVSAQFLKAGFGAKDLAKALPAAFDIAGFTGGGLANVQEAVSALSRISTTGRVDNRSLLRLGLGENAESNLFERMKKDSGKTVNELKKLMADGKLDPKFILDEVYNTIAQREGGQLGNTAKKMSETIESKLAHLKDLPEKFFERWANSPSFNQFKNALTTVLDKLNPDKPLGKKIAAGIETITTKVVGLISQFANGDTIERFANAVSNVGGTLMKLPQYLDAIVTTSEILAGIWAASKMVSAVTSLTSALPALGTAAGTIAPIFAGMAIPIAAAAGAITGIGLAIYGVTKAVSTFNEERDYRKQYGIEGKTAEGMDAETRRLKEIRDRTRAERGWAPIGEIPAPSTRAKPVNMSTMQTANINAGAIVINAPGGDTDQISNSLNESLPGAMSLAMAGMNP